MVRFNNKLSIHVWFSKCHISQNQLTFGTKENSHLQFMLGFYPSHYLIQCCIRPQSHMHYALQLSQKDKSETKFERIRFDHELARSLLTNSLPKSFTDTYRLTSWKLRHRGCRLVLRISRVKSSGVSWNIRYGVSESSESELEYHKQFVNLKFVVQV